jgi:hypothetical protein
MENWKGITVKFSTFRKRPNMLAVSRTEEKADMASTIMEMVGFGKDSGKITGKMAMVSLRTKRVSKLKATGLMVSKVKAECPKGEKVFTNKFSLIFIVSVN